MDYTVHGILQVRILEWVAYAFSRKSSQARDQTQVSHISGRLFTSWAKGSPSIQEVVAYSFSSRSFQPRNQTGVPALQADSLPAKLPGKPPNDDAHCESARSRTWTLLIHSQICSVYIHYNSFIHLYGHLGCFPILSIRNNTAVNFGVHISFWIDIFIFFRHIPRSGIAKSYGISTLSFLKNLCTVSIGPTPIKNFINTVPVFPVFPPSSPTFGICVIYFLFIFVGFLTIVILTDVRWYFFVGLIFIKPDD